MRSRPAASAGSPFTTTAARHRLLLAVAAAVTVTAGLTVRLVFDGAWTGPAGDGLYAVLVYLLLAFLAPRARSVGVAAAAFLVCAGIELFQLTGVPAQLAQEWPPTAWVLGVGFSAADLVAYAVGAVAAALVDSALRRAGAGRRLARA